MHKNATKCNKTLSKWCKNKHGASNIIDTFETYQAWWWRRPLVVIPLSGRVSGRASRPSRSSVNDGSGLQYVSWKIDRVLRVFPSSGIYRRKGGVRRWARWPHHLVARPGAGLRHPMVWAAPSPPPSQLWTSSCFGKNRNFGFCFVQFREYFLCSFSETQK
jgi:hypothetical protein